MVKEYVYGYDIREIRACFFPSKESWIPCYMSEYIRYYLLQSTLTIEDWLITYLDLMMRNFISFGMSFGTNMRLSFVKATLEKVSCQLERSWVVVELILCAKLEDWPELLRNNVGLKLVLVLDVLEVLARPRRSILERQ